MRLEDLVMFFELHGVGRYEVNQVAGGEFIITPLAHNEVIVTMEAHKQNTEFFRELPD